MFSFYFLGHSNTFTKATVNGCGVTVYYSNFDSFHTSSVEAVVIRDNITLGASAPISFAGVYEESPDFADFEVNFISDGNYSIQINGF